MRTVFTMVLNVIPRITVNQVRYISNLTASITKVHRPIYERTYPSLLVLPDGSSIRFKYPEPRPIIRLPFDIRTLSPEELRRHVERRKPKKKVKVEEDLKQTFDPRKYASLAKKKK